MKKIFNLMKTHRKKLVIVNTILFLFVVINVFTFNSFLNSKEWHSDTKRVNTYMAGALTINTLYLVPLSKMLNVTSPILKPFSFIQDSLYRKGLSFLPTDDAEKEIWWFKVKFIDFYQDYSLAIIRRKENNSFFEKYLNGIYDHFYGLSHYKTINSEFRVKRYDIFISTAVIYINDTINLYKISDKNLINLYTDESQMQKITDLFNWVTYLREYVEKNEPKGIENLYNSDTFYSEMWLINSLTQLIIGEEFYKNKNNCPKELLNTNGVSFSYLFYHLNHENEKFKKKSLIHKTMIKLRLIDDLELIKKMPKSCSYKLTLPINDIK